MCHSTRLSRLQVDGEDEENDVDHVSMAEATAVDDAVGTASAEGARNAEDFLDEDEIAALEAAQEDA